MATTPMHGTAPTQSGRAAAERRPAILAVEYLVGSLGVGSEPGHTTFTVRLPLPHP